MYGGLILKLYIIIEDFYILIPIKIKTLSEKKNSELYLLSNV